MKQRKINLVFIFAAALFCCTILFPVSTDAQRRDYMTDAEIELIRDAQEIDSRIDVLTKMIDRRFLALNVAVPETSQKVNTSEKWGEAPTGSRIELLSDIKKLLQKAIDDIDNVAAHATEKQAKTKAEKKEAQRFPNAVRNLAAAANRYLPVLKTQLDQTAAEKEKGSILDSIDFCNQIIEAAGKLPSTSEKT